MHHSITSMISKEVNEVRGSIYQREANSKAFLCQLLPGMRKLPEQGNTYVVTQKDDFVTTWPMLRLRITSLEFQKCSPALFWCHIMVQGLFAYMIWQLSEGSLSHQPPRVKGNGMFIPYLAAYHTQQRGTMKHSHHSEVNRMMERTKRRLYTWVPITHSHLHN